MKGEEKQRKFHETFLKMLYPPPSPPLSDCKSNENFMKLFSKCNLRIVCKQEEEEKEDDEEETILIESLNCPSEEEIESEELSPPCSKDDGGAGKFTQGQRKRLRKRKLKEAGFVRGR